MDRKVVLSRLAAAHDAWVSHHLTSVEFTSQPDVEDYNLWYVDMDAAAQDEFMATAEKILSAEDTLE